MADVSVGSLYDGVGPVPTDEVRGTKEALSEPFLGLAQDIHLLHAQQGESQTPQMTVRAPKVRCLLASRLHSEGGRRRRRLVPHALGLLPPLALCILLLSIVGVEPSTQSRLLTDLLHTDGVWRYGRFVPDAGGLGHPGARTGLAVQASGSPFLGGKLLPNLRILLHIRHSCAKALDN